MGVGEVFTASDQDPAIARQSHRTNGGGGLYAKNKRHFPSVLKRPKLTIIGESSTTAFQKLLQHQGPSLVKIQNFTAQQPPPAVCPYGATVAPAPGCIGHSRRPIGHFLCCCGPTGH